jgi:hypothetical protein
VIDAAIGFKRSTEVTLREINGAIIKVGEYVWMIDEALYIDDGCGINKGLFQHALPISGHLFRVLVKSLGEGDFDPFRGEAIYGDDARNQPHEDTFLVSSVRAACYKGIWRAARCRT